MVNPEALKAELDDTFVGPQAPRLLVEPARGLSRKDPRRCVRGN